jgi:uncharacterized membrane protein YsdA (DUF1294 family)
MALYYFLWLGVTSIATFALYGFDKSRATVPGADRVPERTLHFCSLVGGFAGGWLGRVVFRHKTQKPIFAVILAVATIVHCVLGFWLLKPL